MNIKGRYVQRKVRAYITRNNCKLLVFRHTQFPEAGIQVPGGTVEDGEDWEGATLREAREETDIEGLRLMRLLGEVEYGERGVVARYYHLRVEADVLERWRHFEATPSDGSDFIEFELFWTGIGDAGQLLVPWMADFLEELQRSVGESRPV